MAEKIYILKSDPTHAPVDGRATFQVQGSAAKPYHVVFTKSGTNLTAHCTCPAGLKRQHCKHRVDILLRKPTAIVSDNRGMADQVAGWLEGSDVGQAIHDLETAQRNPRSTPETIRRYKKKIARTLMD